MEAHFRVGCTGPPPKDDEILTSVGKMGKRQGSGPLDIIEALRFRAQPGKCQSFGIRGLRKW